ncbi:hypothetical protein JW859_10625 [bacterium]|nr:hypothetical protein [bacterium]
MLVFSLLLLGLVPYLGGCGGTGHQPVPPAEPVPSVPGLAWPPPETGRLVSAHENIVFGCEWSDKSDSAASSGYSLQLTGGGALPWALFSLDGLGPENELTRVTVSYSESPLSTGDGTQLFIGLADYDQQGWAWFNPVLSPWSQELSNPADYRSPTGQAHVAVVLVGPGTASVGALNFTLAGDLPTVPENLSADPTGVGAVDLSWDSAAHASGYNVYRDDAPGLPEPQLLNAEPVVETAYSDTLTSTGKYYYYYVTATGLAESAPSAPVDIWAHEVEYPAPENLRLTEKTTTSLTFGWDLEGSNPGAGYYLYIATTADFRIDDDETERLLVGPWASDFELKSFQGAPLETGVTYFAKVCIRSSGNKTGRLSNEAAGQLGDYWDFSDIEMIDRGEVPLKAVKTDGGFACAYYDGIAVNLAVSTGAGWQAETPLPAVGELLYAVYLDLAYANGVYLLVAMDKAAGDAWAAYGAPGAWTRDRVHGDGDTTLLHIESGFHIICAASATELAVLHLLDQPPPDQPTMTLHTRPIAGGSWSDFYLRTFDMSENPYTLAPLHCLAYRNGDLYYLHNDGFESGLFFTSRNLGWDFTDTDIRTGDYKFLAQPDLAWFDGGWRAISLDNYPDRRGLYLFSGDETSYPWQMEPLTPIGDYMGYNARLDADGDEAAVVYYGDGIYHLALYSNNWLAEDLYVPGVAELGDSVDVLLDGGEIYLFFRDQATGEIKVAHGVPPE